MPEPRYDYEARRTVGLRINSEKLRFFNVHLNLRTRMFLHVAPLKCGRRRDWESYPRRRLRVLRLQILSAFIQAFLLTRVSILYFHIDHSQTWSSISWGNWSDMLNKDTRHQKKKKKNVVALAHRQEKRWQMWVCPDNVCSLVFAFFFFFCLFPCFRKIYCFRKHIRQWTNANN